MVYGLQRFLFFLTLLYICDNKIIRLWHTRRYVNLFKRNNGKQYRKKSVNHKNLLTFLYLTDFLLHSRNEIKHYHMLVKWNYNNIKFCHKITIYHMKFLKWKRETNNIFSAFLNAICRSYFVTSNILISEIRFFWNGNAYELKENVTFKLKSVQNFKTNG